MNAASRLVAFILISGIAGGAFAQDQAPASPPPLMTQLSRAFGSQHEAATNSAFIQDVLKNRITKAQYQVHLEQRAIVNQEIDRILSRSKSTPLPYGPDQKQVLVLLRSDLSAIGAKWPSKRAAWPETTQFLSQLRDSEKNGPYFALGVFHVYYGGITHGGRDLGAMMADQLKVNPTYYLKSDGYDEYARQVNTITDPTAQQEMIRGGVEAYKYIIGINNNRIFAGELLQIGAVDVQSEAVAHKLR